MTIGSLLVMTGVARAQPPFNQEGLYTVQQADRGEALYRRECERCHAPDLAGGKVVPEMVGQTFAARWNGRTIGDLFERILVSMPPDHPSGMDRRDTTDIVAFILAANGFPPGDHALPGEVAILSQYPFAPPDP